MLWGLTCCSRGPHSVAVRWGSWEYGVYLTDSRQNQFVELSQGQSKEVDFPSHLTAKNYMSWGVALTKELLWHLTTCSVVGTNFDASKGIFSTPYPRSLSFVKQNV